MPRNIWNPDDREEKERRLEVEECQAINLFGKLSAVKVDYQVH